MNNTTPDRNNKLSPLKEKFDDTVSFVQKKYGKQYKVFQESKAYPLAIWLLSMVIIGTILWSLDEELFSLGTNKTPSKVQSVPPKTETQPAPQNTVSVPSAEKPETAFPDTGNQQNPPVDTKKETAVSKPVPAAAAPQKTMTDQIRKPEIAKDSTTQVQKESLKSQNQVVNPPPAQTSAKQQLPQQPETRSAKQVIARQDVQKAKTPAISKQDLEKQEKRFQEIIAAAPLKFELNDFIGSTDSFPVISGNALSINTKELRKNRRNGQTPNLYKLSYKVTLKNIFKRVGRGQNAQMVCPIMKETVLASEFGKSIVPDTPDQIRKIHEQIFTPETSFQTLTQRLDELERNISTYNIAGYTISVKLTAYSEDHKAVAQTGRKVKFEIHTVLHAEVTVYNKINKTHRLFKYELTTRTPGNITFAPGYSSTANIRWNRMDVFRISAEKLADLLIADLLKKQRK